MPGQKERAVLIAAAAEENPVNCKNKHKRDGTGYSKPDHLPLPVRRP